MSRTTARVGTLIALCLICLGCASGVRDKSGGTEAMPPPVVLVLASSRDGGETGIGRQLNAVPAVDQFVRRVSEVSGGRVSVSVRRDDVDDVSVIRDVAAGGADLGWAATAAFDVVGVRAFEPLHAPFLIHSYAAESAVVKDPLAGRMLAALSQIGLTGLALAADELQIPAAAKPLLTPADFRGLKFGAHDSRIQSMGLVALGAEPSAAQAIDPIGPDITWWDYVKDPRAPFLPHVTGNAALWPRTLAIFASTERMKSLDEQVRAWLAEAADSAATWSAEHNADRLPFEIEQACATSVRINIADASQLAALRAAAEPVYRELRADPALSETLTRIETLVGSVEQGGPELHPRCSDASQAGDATAPPIRFLTAAGRPGSLPPGTYRYTVTEEELRAHGDNDFAARATAGVWTWTLRGGHWMYHFAPSSSSVPEGSAFDTCEGWYDVEADAVAFTTSNSHQATLFQCAPEYWSARWSLTTDGLRMTSFFVDEPLPVYLFGGKIWQRIN